MFRILIADKMGQAGLDRLAQAEDITYDVKMGAAKEELLAIMPAYDALIVRSGTKVDADLLNAGTNLKVVGRAGIGVDNIDVKAATARGIVVMNTPRANAVATAEHAMALMLGVSRHIAPAHASLLAGEWERSKFTGVELNGKTLGIIGFGNIGRLVAARAQAFGMEVIAYDPYISEAVAHETGVTLVDLEDLLPQADYITLHASSTPETQQLINAQAISQMKDGAVLINGARGKLVDEAALADALKSGKLKAAAVDVYSSEPPPAGHPLLGLPNVLHTPHLGASTKEAQKAVAEEIVDQVLDALRGNGIRHAVNMPFSVGPGFEELEPHMALATTLGILQYHLAGAPIHHIEVEVRGERCEELVRPVASALLMGVLRQLVDGPVNYVNAPLLAEQQGITITQSHGLGDTDYPNLIYCRAHTGAGQRTLAGVLFGGREQRIVQVDNYHLDANPTGTLLVLQNRDVPGVIGQVGTILSAYNVNIGEWRMGRFAPGGEALSFINLDSIPPVQVLDALEKVPAITQVKLINL